MRASAALLGAQVLVGHCLAGPAVRHNISSSDACCSLCRSDATCRAGVWQQSTATCYLGGQYAFAKAEKPGELRLACANPSARGATETCKYVGLRDYRATYAATLKGVSQAADCCAACFAWDSCKVGLWDSRWNECYLKGGFVAEASSSNADVVACVARPNPPRAPEFDCSRPGADCAGRVGATHWAPCYAVNNSLPSLLDGARSIRAMGSKVIKVALFRPSWNYPLNSPEWPKDGVVVTPEAVARHRYFRSLWEMDFETFVLVAYSTVGNSSVDYWAHGITEKQEKEEEEQLRAVASFLLSEYPSKTFVLQNSEGDWASRGGSGSSRPATPAAFSSMARWLRARQAGVTSARTAARKKGALGNVYLAAEVNLILEPLRAKVPCVVDQVLPEVPVDMISYSGYDTQQVLPDLEEAMAFALARHRRTPASPPNARALLLGEFGLPQASAPAEEVRRVVGDVVNSALSFGVAFVLFWEVYCNECKTPGQDGCSLEGRCRDPQRPVSKPEELRGFWLVRPNGSFAWPREYLAAKLAGAPQQVLLQMRETKTLAPEAPAKESGQQRQQRALLFTALPIALATAVLVPMYCLACWHRYRGPQPHHAPPSRQAAKYEPVATVVGAVEPGCDDDGPFSIT